MVKLIALLIRHEGEHLKPYKCPADKLTIGVGHNIEDNGISEEISRLILKEDILNTMTELSLNFCWFCELNTPRQDAIINMCFNLGLPRFKTFTNMIRALESENWKRAAYEMLNSKWAGQVGKRAEELAAMIRRGAY